MALSRAEKLVIAARTLAVIGLNFALLSLRDIDSMVDDVVCESSSDGRVNKNVTYGVFSYRYIAYFIYQFAISAVSDVSALFTRCVDEWWRISKNNYPEEKITLNPEETNSSYVKDDQLHLCVSGIKGTARLMATTDNSIFLAVT